MWPQKSIFPFLSLFQSSVRKTAHASGQSALSASKFSYLGLNKGYEFGQTLVTREFLDINLMYGVMPVMHLEYSSMNLHPVATTVTIPIVYNSIA